MTPNNGVTYPMYRKNVVCPNRSVGFEKRQEMNSRLFEKNREN